MQPKLKNMHLCVAMVMISLNVAPTDAHLSYLYRKQCFGGNIVPACAQYCLTLFKGGFSFFHRRGGKILGGVQVICNMPFLMLRKGHERLGLFQIG